MALFGWFNRKKHTAQPMEAIPVSPPSDGGYVINTGIASGYFNYGYNLEIDSVVKNEFEMILRYRDTAAYPEADTAIEQIISEMFIVDNEEPIQLNVDNLPKQFKGISKKILEEWENVLELYNFKNACHDIVKRWYIDGRIYYYMTLDTEHPKKGILDIRYIDPRKIKKVIEVIKEQKDGVDVIKGTKEFYLFNDEGLSEATKGVKLSPDCIVDVPSGLIDATSGQVISYLFKAIKPVNQLKMMEDAQMIYRITRAPERRLFYVDVGNMPAQKAEQYVQNIMNKFRNRVQYDAKTGEIKNGRNYLSMMEDFFLPRREGGKSTEIQTLPSASNLSDIGDLMYFKEKVYQSLGVPKQRLNGENNNFQIGKSDNITRDEIIFAKMIHRLRNCFANFFLIPLKTQLISKKIISEKEWEEIRTHLNFQYAKDNYFEEIKEQEILSDRISLLGQVDGYKGTYFSREWIVKHVLNLSDEEWKEMQKQMEKEEALEPSDDNEHRGGDSGNFGNSDNSDDSEDFPTDSNNSNDSEDDSEDKEKEEDKERKKKLLDSRDDTNKPRGRIGRYVRKLAETD